MPQTKGITRRGLVMGAAVASWLSVMPVCGLHARGMEKPKHPNLVFLLVDDLGWADLGCYGGDLHETPNIDRLARQGMRFTDACAASPVCSPTRASIMTGKHPARLHMTIWYGAAVDPSVNKEKNPKLIPPTSQHNLPHEQVTIAEVLTGAGYFTAHVGKWHLGDEAHYPQTHGFDLNIGGTFSGCPAAFFSPFKDADNNRLPHLESSIHGEYLTDRLTDEALAVIEASKARSFFLHLAYYTVHTPIEGKPVFVAHYRKKIKSGMRHRNANYAAMIHSLDRNIGRVLDKLDRLGIADRTIVILSSDNGGAHYKYKNEIITDNTPLRAGKGTLYEGGTRVPLIVRFPGVTPAGSVCRRPLISTDFYPTILDMVGLQGDPQHNRNLDGVSFVPLLKDPTATLKRDALYWHYPHYYYGMNTPVSSIRQGNWKLLMYYEDRRVELYNLHDDPGETRDLAKTLPQKADELRKGLRDWRRRINAPMPKPNPNWH